MSFGLTFASTTYADELAQKSLKSWRAFECAVLAEVIGDMKEQARLFKLGHSEGAAFLEALVDLKMSKDDIRSLAPLPFILRLDGPSHDFRMGRIFEAAVETVFRDVFPGNPEASERPGMAEVEFRRRNCRLIQ